MPTLGVDFAWSRPEPQAIKAAGYDFVVRYLSTDDTKDLSDAERDALHAAGLGIALVWEAGATNALGGSEGGTVDAQRATQLADALGYPVECPLFFAVDFNAGATQMPAIRGYFAAAGAHSPRPVGPYGSSFVIEGLGYRWNWQTSAWSGSTVNAKASLYQRQRPTLTISGAAAGSYDENVLLDPALPLWTAQGASVTATGGTKVAALNRPVCAIVNRPQGDGYWVVCQDGGIFNFGAAANFGAGDALPSEHLNGLIVDATATPSGAGLILVGSDGGIFTFGDATLSGSVPALGITKSAQGWAV